MINATSERLRAGNFFICRYFSYYEQLKFHVQLSQSSMKKVLYPLGLEWVGILSIVCQHNCKERITPKFTGVITGIGLVVHIMFSTTTDSLKLLQHILPFPTFMIEILTVALFFCI